MAYVGVHEAFLAAAIAGISDADDQRASDGKGGNTHDVSPLMGINLSRSRKCQPWPPFTLILIKIAIRGAPAAGRSRGFARGWAEIRAPMAFPASASHAAIEIIAGAFPRLPLNRVDILDRFVEDSIHALMHCGRTLGG